MVVVGRVVGGSGGLCEPRQEARQTRWWLRCVNEAMGYELEHGFNILVGVEGSHSWLVMAKLEETG